MSGSQPPRAGSTRANALARAALALYPAPWRARYGDEVRTLLEDSGTDLRGVLSLAWQAIPAWIWPARHLHDRPARMRASLGTVLLTWTALIGLMLVFAQLTQAQPASQGLTLARHPIIGWAYWVFDAAALLSLLAVAAGGLPLWRLMITRARREHRRRDVAYLLSPVVVPVMYLVVVTVVARIVRHTGGPKAYPRQNAVIDLANGGISPAWFLALVVLGLAAGVAAATGPRLALRRLRPNGPAIGRATSAAGVAAAAIGLAGTASVVAAVGLYWWAPGYAGYHQGWPLVIYLPIVLLVATVGMVSAARGIRASRSPAAA